MHVLCVVCKHASAIFWDSVIGFIASSVPSSWSWTVQHFLRAGTLSGIVYRSATVSVFYTEVLHKHFTLCYCKFSMIFAQLQKFVRH